MTRRRVVGITILIALIAVVAGVLSIARTLRQPGEIEMMRDSVQALRSRADECRQLLDAGQAELHAYNARLDSLRGRVRELESHDPRGVPADSYPAYMRIVAQYNDSVGEWSGRVEALQADLGRCREVTEAHNEAALVLRRLIAERRNR